MTGCHAATVTRCDSRADFDVCPCCGYSAAGKPFGACPYNSYSTTAGSLSTSVPAVRSYKEAADYLTMLMVVSDVLHVKV